jgi:hypothetical protein
MQFFLGFASKKLNAAYRSGASKSWIKDPSIGGDTCTDGSF